MNKEKIRCERVSVDEAAKILGMAPYMVRFRMKKKTLPIGRAIPPEQTGSGRWEFRIYRALLEKEVGRTLE